MQAACTSPGSRSTPIVVSLTREPHIRCYSHLDERCSGFFALGLAKASGRPVAIACTSGTAAANLAPAVIEAHEARVPLLVLSADRPPELRDSGAGQTIDQLKLYGSAVKWFAELDCGSADEARRRWIRTLACRAYWRACEGRPGPVHINVPLREPLVTDDELPRDDTARSGRAPYLAAARREARRAEEPREARGADRGRSARGRRGGAIRARRTSRRRRRGCNARRRRGGLLRGDRLATAGRPALGRAPRGCSDRALRRASARAQLRRTRAP